VLPTHQVVSGPPKVSGSLRFGEVNHYSKITAFNTVIRAQQGSSRQSGCLSKKQYGILLMNQLAAGLVLLHMITVTHLMINASSG